MPALADDVNGTILRIIQNQLCDFYISSLACPHSVRESMWKLSFSNSGRKISTGLNINTRYCIFSGISVDL